MSEMTLTSAPAPLPEEPPSGCVLDPPPLPNLPDRPRAASGTVRPAAVSEVHA
ncbi:hypothetical protein [Streptomyces sp. NPDC054786]